MIGLICEMIWKNKMSPTTKFSFGNWELSNVLLVLTKEPTRVLGFIVGIDHKW